MNNAHFAKALQFTLGNEKGYVNHPLDPGGPTNMGITQSTLARWRGKSVSAEDVKNLDVNEARAIYVDWYWTPMHCDEIYEDCKSTVLFDAAVLFGIYGASTCAQRATGRALKIDGHIGALSVAAINELHPKLFLVNFAYELALRANAVVVFRPASKVFLDGWLNRVDEYPKLAS